MAATTHSITGFVKDVRRHRETRDFDAYVIHPDSTEVYLGSRERSWDAEQLCDEYVYAQLQQQPVVEVEAIAAADPLAALRAEIDATTEPNTRRRLMGGFAYPPKTVH